MREGQTRWGPLGLLPASLVVAVVATLALAGCGSGDVSGTGSGASSGATSPASGIRGTVVLTGAFGRVPFADARVLVRGPDGRLLRQTTAGRDGAFQVKATPGDYEVCAVYQGTPSPPQSVHVTGGACVAVRIHVAPAALPSPTPRGTGSSASLLAGSIERGQAEDTSAAGACLVVQPTGGGPGVDVQPGPGGWFFVALPPGGYVVRGAVTGDGRTRAVVLRPMAVTRVALPPIFGRAGGEAGGSGAAGDAEPPGYLDGFVAIAGRQGQTPWVGAAVKVRSCRGGPWRVVVTGADGRFYLVLPPGKYVVRSGFFGSRGGTRSVVLRAGAVSPLSIAALITQVGGEFSDATARLPHQGAAGDR